MALIKPSGLSLMGGTLRGALRFSGTLHPGLIVLSLTTAQRDALTPELGMVIFNVTTGDFEGYDGAWGGLGGGGVSGPISSVDNEIPLFNGVGGDAIDGSGITFASNTLNFPTTLTIKTNNWTGGQGIILNTYAGPVVINSQFTAAKLDVAGAGSSVVALQGVTALSAGGSTVLAVGSGFTTVSFFSQVGFQQTVAATNTIQDMVPVTTLTSGAAAAGFGGAITFSVEYSTGGQAPAGRIAALWSTATGASRIGDVRLDAYDFVNTPREFLRGRANGSAAEIGFLGATPVARAAHIADAAGDDAATVNAILVVLENLGLVATS